MKNLFRASVFLLCAFGSVIFADDFKSKTIIGSPTASETVQLGGGELLLIRNFTQDTGSARGMIMVTKPPSSNTTVSVLAAAILDISPLEVINSVVITGPADVTVTCPDASAICFVSYKKVSN